MLRSFGISAILFLTFILPGSLTAQDLDYELVFGDDWHKAESFISQNRSWMEPVLEDNNIPFRVAVAVIFPEIVRYSALRDRMEITLLKTLYVNLGDEYANFSIGHFQIKPSFASIIREEAPHALGRKSDIHFRLASDFEDISNYRKSIIVDLEDPKTQFNYIIAFFHICEKKYKTRRMSEPDRIKFLATAYNYGIDKSAEQIRKMIPGRYFSTNIFKSVTYSYSDISMYWYKHQTGLLQSAD
jgi:hypothetical protein